MSAQSLRSVGPLPYVHVVDPKGRIRHYRYGKGVNSRVIQYTRDGPELTADGHKAGWALLKELYATDPDEQIREQGFKVWEDYNAHAARSLNDAPFPEEWLPAEVMRRRTDSTAAARAPFQAPPRSTPEPEKRGPGRPRKDAA